MTLNYLKIKVTVNQSKVIIESLVFQATYGIKLLKNQ